MIRGPRWRGPRPTGARRRGGGRPAVVVGPGSRRGRPSSRSGSRSGPAGHAEERLDRDSVSGPGRERRQVPLDRPTVDDEPCHSGRSAVRSGGRPRGGSRCDRWRAEPAGHADVTSRPGAGGRSGAVELGRIPKDPLRGRHVFPRGVPSATSFGLPVRRRVGAGINLRVPYGCSGWTSEIASRAAG